MTRGSVQEEKGQVARMRRLSEEKPDQGCVQKSLLHSKNNRKQLDEVLSKDEVRGAGSFTLSEVPQAAVQRTNQREDSMAPGRPGRRLKWLSSAERVVAWLRGLAMKMENNWFHGCVGGKLDDT